MAIVLGSVTFDETHTTVRERFEEVGGRDARAIDISGVIVGDEFKGWPVKAGKNKNGEPVSVVICNMKHPSDAIGLLHFFRPGGQMEDLLHLCGGKVDADAIRERLFSGDPIAVAPQRRTGK